VLESVRSLLVHTLIPRPVYAIDRPQESNSTMPKSISCVCDSLHDDGALVKCKSYSTWQHPKCYYVNEARTGHTYFDYKHPNDVDLGM
jgi:hypothetical protein